MIAQRDKVWSAAIQLIEFNRSITATDIQDTIEIDDDNPPSTRLIRDTLDSMESFGLLDSTGGRGRAPRQFSAVKPESDISVGGYTPRQTSSGNCVFPFPGGKARLAEWIITHLPDHDCFVEVFGGGAGLTYNKPKSKYEVYNDIDDDLTNFFRVLRDKPEDLSEWLQSVAYSRSQYQQWVSEFYSGSRPDDPVVRAGQFFCVRHMQFIGSSAGANAFKIRARRSPARTFDRQRQRLESMASRFNQVIIENRDYRDILDLYDDPAVSVLFYLDPPYRNTSEQYGVDFDHDILVDKLQAVENDWILSTCEILDGLEDHTIVEREARHRMARDRGDVTERLICSFDPDTRQNWHVQ